MSNSWLVTLRVASQLAAAGCIGWHADVHSIKFWGAEIALIVATWAAQEFGERIGFQLGQRQAWRSGR